MDFEIVTDSSSNLKEEMIDEFGLHILPLTFMVDGEQRQSYLKGQVTDLQEFYTMMREGKVITTSLPNLAASEALLRGLLESGKDVLYLGFSSGLSGTYEAISLLCGQLAAEFPERRVYTVDTLAASGGEGQLVLSREQIVEMLRVFLTESTNEARVLDRVDATVKQVAERVIGMNAEHAVQAELASLIESAGEERPPIPDLF